MTTHSGLVVHFLVLIGTLCGCMMRSAALSRRSGASTEGSMTIEGGAANGWAQGNVELTGFKD